MNGIYRDRGIASVGRYGVQASIMKGPDGEAKTVVMRSLPDFEGVQVFTACDGRRIFPLIFDCKVCGQASFQLAKYRSETGGSLSRQLSHMMERSRFGVDCFFLIHWTERQLKTKTEPAITYRFPVEENPFWKQFLRGESKSITRDDCEHFGSVVEWKSVKGGRKLRPEYLGVL